MSVEIEIMASISIEFTIEDFNKVYKKLNNDLLENSLSCQFITDVIEQGRFLTKKEFIGQSDNFFEFQGQFDVPFLVSRNDEPHDDFYTASETILSEANFDKNIAIKLSKKIQEINVSYKVKWRHEKEILKGLIFLLCLCVLHCRTQPSIQDDIPTYVIIETNTLEANHLLKKNK